MSDVEIPIKSLVSGMMGLLFGGIFVFMTWLDAWVYFGVVIVAGMLLVNQNFTLFPVGIIGMFGAGVFTKIGWLDPIVFFSALILSAVVLAQQIVSRQLDIGHGSSGTSGGK